MVDRWLEASCWTRSMIFRHRRKQSVQSYRPRPRFLLGRARLPGKMNRRDPIALGGGETTRPQVAAFAASMTITHVPLMIHVPGAAEACERHGRPRLIYRPTIFDLAGLRRGPKRDGPDTRCCRCYGEVEPSRQVSTVTALPRQRRLISPDAVDGVSRALGVGSPPP